MKNIFKEDVAKWMPTRDTDTYKNKLGHVLCIGGNEKMGGAIILSASAALYSGAGLVTVASAPVNLHALHARIPEAMFVNFYEMKDLIAQIKKADTIVIGPGLGLSEESENIFKTVLQNVSEDQWLIIDGDAITLFATGSTTLPNDKVIFTPHLGEWEKLTGIQAPADDLKQNKKAQEKLSATVVLKKAKTEIYFTDETWHNTAGNPSMATGGMGDTLTGILASFLGQFQNKEQAILSAVYIHSAVADELAKTNDVTLPSKIIEHLPSFIKSLKD